MTYYLIYFGFYSFLLALLAGYLFKWKAKVSASRVFLFCSFLVVIVSLYFGFRGEDVGSDTSTYVNNYLTAGSSVSFSSYMAFVRSSGILFYGLFYICAHAIPVSFVFTFFSLLFFISFLLFLSVRFKEELFPLLINLLGLFSIISLNINIIRIGFALSFFFLFLYFNERKKWYGWLFLLLSVLSHVTILIIIIPYFISKWVKSINLYYALWFVALFFAVLHLGLLDLPFVKTQMAASSHFSYYLTNPDHYKTGFRLDFTLFNFLFIVLGYFAYRQKEKPYYFKMYLLISALFLSLYPLTASDRIGLFSWILIPLIILDFSRIDYFKDKKMNHKVYFSAVVIIAFVSIFLIFKKFI